MKAQIQKCLDHGRLNEIFCNGCKKFICARCLSFHEPHNTEGEYIHVLKYAQDKITPIFDSLIESAAERERNIEKESVEVITRLQEIMPRLTEAITLQQKKLIELKSITERLKDYCNQATTERISENSIINGIITDKEKLEKALKDKDVSETLKLSVKIRVDQTLTKEKVHVKDLMKNLDNAMKELKEQTELERALATINGVLVKCNSLQLIPYINDWRCDRAYLSTKMYLSEDGLTFGNTATNGYPAIIGNVPFDSGLYAFEVIPHGLECAKKEGFGIIEKEKYLAAFARDATTPTVGEDMIGFLYSKEYKNMKAIRAGEMRMDTKYYVKVNIPELTVVIFGPDLLLKANLKPNVVYYPCFSCGCSNNRITIRPLTTYNEVEEPE